MFDYRLHFSSHPESFPPSIKFTSPFNIVRAEFTEVVIALLVMRSRDPSIPSEIMIEMKEQASRTMRCTLLDRVSKLDDCDLINEESLSRCTMY